MEEWKRVSRKSRTILRLFQIHRASPGNYIMASRFPLPFHRPLSLSLPGPTADRSRRLTSNVYYDRTTDRPTGSGRRHENKGGEKRSHDRDRRHDVIANCSAAKQCYCNNATSMSTSGRSEGVISTLVLLMFNTLVDKTTKEAPKACHHLPTTRVRIRNWNNGTKAKKPGATESRV